MFILIFRFSSKNSVLKVLFANIPPTLAAALITTSGLKSSIVFLVCSKLKRSVSFLLDAKTLLTFGDLFNTLTHEEPTNPLEPNTNTFFLPLKR